MFLSKKSTDTEEDVQAATASGLPSAEGGEKSKPRKKHKVMWIVLGSIIGIIAVLAAVIGIFAARNTKQMNLCIDEIVAAVSEGHTVKKIETGEFSDMRVYSIVHIQSEQYEVEGIGNLSLMKVNAGIMQMATAVLAPANKDIPLLSCDYMYILGNRTAYIEQYDVCEVRDDTYNAWTERFGSLFAEYGDLPDTQASGGWYDSILTSAAYKATKPASDEKIREMLIRSIKLYLEEADSYPELTGDMITSKLDRVKAYSDRLIDEGGVSTNFFVSAFGTDKTRSFFDNVFFGTEKYRK